MKERPILYSDSMVRAVLQGRKTQTRRSTNLKEVNQSPDDWVLCTATGDLHENPTVAYDRAGKHRVSVAAFWNEESGKSCFAFCPYGKPGDQLWVRECFCEDWSRDAAGGTRTYIGYRSDGYEPHVGTKWKPSIFMKRPYSRIQLEIVSVRVERVKDITEVDALAEGILKYAGEGYSWRGSARSDQMLCSARLAFANLINEIHGGKNWNLYYNDSSKYPVPLWEQNPWVWVVEFKVVKGGV